MTPKERIAELRREVELNPASRYFYQLGELLRREGELEEAAAILRQGLTHHPRYMAAWVSLGRALLDLQDANGARQALRQALDLDPQNPVAWRLLGEAYLALTQRSEALQAFEQALALVPGDEVLQEAVATLKAELAAPSSPGLLGPSPPSEVLPEPFAEIHPPPPPPAEELFVVEPLPSLEMDTVFALPPEPPPVAPALDFLPEGLAPPAAQEPSSPFPDEVGPLPPPGLPEGATVAAASALPTSAAEEVEAILEPPVAPAQASPPTIAEARACVHRGDLAQAVELLRQLVEAEPANQEAADLLALVQDMMEPLPPEEPKLSLREKKIAALQRFLANVTLARERMGR